MIFFVTVLCYVITFFVVLFGFWWLIEQQQLALQMYTIIGVIFILSVAGCINEYFQKKDNGFLYNGIPQCAMTAVAAAGLVFSIDNARQERRSNDKDRKH
uniref:MARVEL domain-containing protein n=1 Tax=Steinernema glaseri TaxID=37863 RepID=A0A1I7ZTU4_9BILA